MNHVSFQSRNPAAYAVITAARRLSQRHSVSGSGFAFDRSVRSYDADGRLRVSTALLTRACVSDYLGAEIPDYQSLGLDPNRIYSLLRPEDELRKSVGKYCNLPVLRAHIPVSARDHKPDAVVGATGSNAKFDGTDLTCDLIVWAQGAIDAIEDKSARALSVGYGYTPVMTPGSYRGVRYDGIMTQIEPNHLALCDQARVLGAMVGDSMPKTGMKRSKQMDAGGPEVDPDYDVTEVFGNIVTYLQDLLSTEQMTVVQGLIDGDDLPESNGGAMDADGALRARLAEHVRTEREFHRMFPGAGTLKLR